jgi:hypothetical protein
MPPLLSVAGAAGGAGWAGAAGAAPTAAPRGGGHLAGAALLPGVMPGGRLMRGLAGDYRLPASAGVAGVLPADR